VSKLREKSKRLAYVWPPGYLNTTDLGYYLGAKSTSTAHERVAFLRAHGLKCYRVAGVRLFRRTDADDLLITLQGEGSHE
jgi:hypothetical protein